MTMSLEYTPSSDTNVNEEVVTLVRSWLSIAATYPVEPAAQRLAEVLKDPNGLAFTVGFVDGVMRPEDLGVASHALEALSPLTPKFLPWYLQGAVRTGGVAAPLAPWPVVPIARKVLRNMVGHLVLDATPKALGPAIAKLRESGNRLNLNLLGEAVLGEKEADRRLQGTLDFLRRDDVDYVSIKVSSVVSQLSMWAFDEAVERIVEKLTPLYALAAASATPKFINLDMEEYRDLDLTIAVFTRLLDKPEFTNLTAGIVLQAYLPDSLRALQELTAWSKTRRARGGAPIKVRVVKGANLAMEHVDAGVHGWPVATFPTKQDSDTNYKRVLDWALTPENTDAVRLGVAGHNLFDIAWSWLVASKRGVTDAIEFEMLLGMATGQAAAVRETVGQLLLYTPVVNPAEFDVAIAYLIRRLEENASNDNFMSAVFELTSNPALFEREKERFMRSVEALDTAVPTPNRTQNRQTEADARLAAATSFTHPAPAEAHDDSDDALTANVLGLVRGSGGLLPTFRNEPDTDPALAVNREWGRAILGRVANSQLGIATIDAARIDTAEALDRVIDTVSTRAKSWGEMTGADRASVLHRAGEALAARRAELIEVMASETGKTIAEADPEISEAIDFAHYYAERARELDHVQGATFVPSRLTVVTPPWNFPVAIPAGSTLSALAAGSGVIIKPAPQARRSGAVMVEALWQAGVPRDVLALVEVGENELGRHLIAHPAVDRVILTGGYETAKLFRSFRKDLPLLAETSGKNALIVTPSADFDLAAADVVKSAFGHAGQKCSAASLVILVGSVAKSKRFMRQLVDAATSMRVGMPTDPAAQVGPIVEPASGKLLHALTELGVGEKWVVEPKKLDNEGRLWSPGIRSGVAPGSYFHLTEFFGPVLGIMHASNLEEAIRMQNAVDYGLTAGIHSLDADEIETWLDTVEAGNLYVNRGITGAIVQRQPFGGWKRSAVGAGSKAGGPNYLLGLGSWVPAKGRSSSTLHLRGIDRRVTELIETSQSAIGYEEFDELRRAALSDAIAWRDEFGIAQDVTGLGVERNVFRYRSLPVTVRFSDDATLGDALRILAAALLSRSEFEVSSAIELTHGARTVLAARGIPLVMENDEKWLARVSSIETTRVRLVGGDAKALAEALDGSVDVAVWSHPVTTAGRVELLPFLHEQAISITNHRFGNPTTLTDELL